MNLRHPIIDIPEDNPFLNCKLDRRKYADILKDIVSTGDGFVLAINNEWGTGKTTFIQMWRQLLINEKFRTIYFNAWENDFETTPLPAILAELKILTPKDRRKFNSLLNKGAKIAQNVIPSVTKNLVKNNLGIDISEGVENFTKAATDILKDEISKYTARQKGMLEFRESLREYVSSDESEKPLIFIIDELDRCRPDYAVEFLEHIKHFFSVKGIVFVLAIDKRQLCSSISGAYGSNAFDSTDYLRRFIDIEYTLPLPSADNYCAFLFGYYRFDHFFNSPYRTNHPELQGDSASFIKFSALLFTSAGLTLRQQEKIYAHARVSIKSFRENNYTFPAVFILLIFINKYNSSLYFKIRNKQLSLQEFVSEIELILIKIKAENLFQFILNADALVLYFYAKYYRSEYKGLDLLTYHNDTGKAEVSIKSSLVVGDDRQKLINRLITIDKAFFNTSIDYLLNKIDLIEPLN